MRAILALCLLPGAVHAACPNGTETAFACAFANGKEVHVCADATAASYAFGTPGKTPDLELRVPLAQLDYTPWPGIGRTIWETVVFRNEGVSYAVTGAIERIYPEDETAEVDVRFHGEIEVIEGEKLLARLECEPATVFFAYPAGLYDAMTAAGLCWGHDTLAWAPCR